jgi:hypothetical protein
MGWLPPTQEVGLNRELQMHCILDEQSQVRLAFCLRPEQWRITAISFENRLPFSTHLGQNYPISSMFLRRIFLQESFYTTFASPYRISS